MGWSGRGTFREGPFMSPPTLPAALRVGTRILTTLPILLVAACATPVLKMPPQLPPIVRQYKPVAVAGKLSHMQDTGVDLDKEDLYSIFATGSIDYCFGGRCTARDVRPELGWPLKASIGSVDAPQFRPLWPGTQSATRIAPESGRLYLGIDDTRHDDNHGHFDVDIIVWRAPDDVQIGRFLTELRSRDPHNKVLLSAHDTVIWQAVLLGARGAVAPRLDHERMAVTTPGMAVGPPQAEAPLAPPVVRAPPAITLLEPKPGTVLRGDQAALKVEVKSLARLKTLVVKGPSGDRSYSSPPGAKTGEPWVVEATVALAEGDNVVHLEALDEHGMRAEETVQLTRKSLIAVEFQGPPGTTLIVGNDRHLLDTEGKLTLQLPPGTHQIEAMRDGYLPLRQMLRLTAGQGLAAQRLVMAQIVSPTIVLLEPKAGTLVHTPRAKLRIEVRGPYRVTTLRVGEENDARPQTFAPGAPVRAGETWTVEAVVTLAEGDNRIRLEALDEHGTKGEQTIVLTRQSLVALELQGPPGAEVRINNSLYTLAGYGKTT